MNWKTEVFVEGEWAGNNLVFATKQEAIDYGHELLSRWWVPIYSRPVETLEVVNYVFENGHATSL